MRSIRWAGLATGAAVLVLMSSSASAHDPNSAAGREEARRLEASYQAPVRVAQAAATCVNGMAGQFPCRNVDLLAHMPLSSIGGGSMGNSMWSWVDPSNGREYILALRSNGTSFVDVTDPADPVYLGNLPSHNGTSSSWRDVKVYNNHAFVGADRISTHGIQVFDLTRLRGVTTPQTFTEDAHYSQLGSSHTLALNPQTGFLYAVGSDTCDTGMHMINVRDPKNPNFAGCVGNDGYVHENQCLIYRGPDAQHAGREICFNYNGDVSKVAARSEFDTLTIVDVTDKANPAQLSRSGYNGSAFTHQGWLTPDHRYLVLNDELDSDTPGSKSFIWDVRDLDNPVNIGVYVSPTIQATDHNHYIMGHYMYQAAYRGGLRILDTAGIAGGTLSEIGYFDIYPSGNTTGFNGAWMVHPFLPSGTIAIMGIEQGLVLVRPTLTPHPDFEVGSVTPGAATVAQGGSATATVVTQTTVGAAQTVDLFVTGLPAGATATFDRSTVASGETATMTIATSATTPPGTYSVNVTAMGRSMAYRDKPFTLTVTGSGGGSCTGTNGTDFAITDNATIESPIAISGCPGSASAGSTVEVHIDHTYIGDLVVDLVAPDGTQVNLHNRGGGSANDIDRTYTVNLSAEAANGTWKLRVRDAAGGDVGKLDTWTLKLDAVVVPGCDGYESTYTGSLASGGTAYEPDGSYFYTSRSGLHESCLDAPAGFELYLQRWNGSWQTVAGPSQTLSYNGTAGYYRYRIRAVSGSGTYTLGYNAP